MNNSGKYNETLRQIIELYPSSIAANESRKLLNIPIENVSFRTDAADSIYVFAAEKLNNNEYAISLEAFQYIIKNHPTSVFIEKTYYATGWLYENIYNKYDSAFYYYSKLMELNPMNEYAGTIAGKIYEYKNSSGNSEIPDTTKIENNNIPVNEPEKEIKDPVKDGTSEDGEMNVPDVNIKSIEEEKMRQQNEGDIEDNK
jgi:tetratricopeptide (TPR) repeat protein